MIDYETTPTFDPIRQPSGVMDGRAFSSSRRKQTISGAGAEDNDLHE